MPNTFRSRTWFQGTCLQAVVAVLALTLPVSSRSAQAQNYSVLYDFKGAPDGSFPTGLVWDARERRLYGVTLDGGKFSLDGTVFQLTRRGTETVLHSFGQPNWLVNPTGSLVRDASGNLYGFTIAFGGNHQGAIFQLDQKRRIHVLHNFTGNGNDGANPTNCGLVRDKHGNLYGTTGNGGHANAGTVFKLDRTGGFKTLHSFCPNYPKCPDGGEPRGGLVLDVAGNLYGTLASFGSNQCPFFACGAVFKLGNSGKVTTLHRFTGGLDGGAPAGGLVQDSAGNLYGTTQLSGANGGGTIFKIKSHGRFSVLYSFCSATNCSDGANPIGGVVLDAQGNIYGATTFGGDLQCDLAHMGCGVVFKLDASTGQQAVLHTFSGGNDGMNPDVSMVSDGAGNFYGVTPMGGPGCAGNLGCGLVFKLSP